MKWSKKLIMSKGTTKNRGRGCEYRGRAIIMAMEAEKIETDKGGSKEENEGSKGDKQRQRKQIS